MNIFCRIYTSHDVSVDVIIDELCVLLDANRVTISDIKTEKFSLFVDSNDEFDLKRQKEFPDGFLYFRNSIGLYDESLTDINLESAVEVVGKLLNYLWHEKKAAAVASCDYEHLLPLKGGYRSHEIPWPN